MPHLFIEPTDVLVFRDGRPFDAGSDHLATGPFPPLPTTLYGALRSALLAGAGADFRRPDFGLGGPAAAVAGTTTQTGSLTITDFALARRRADAPAERLYPAPLDLLQRKTATDDAHGDPAHVLLAPTDAVPAIQSNLPDGLRLLAPAAPHHAGTFYERTTALLTREGLDETLAGRLPTGETLVETDTLFTREPRTQVSLRGSSDAAFTGTAQEGKLFTVDFVRMNRDTGFAAGLEAGGLLGSTGLLRLGGESRPARFEPTDAPAKGPDALRARAAETGRVRVVLTTPAPFAHGWRPNGIDADLRGTLGGVRVRLVAAAVGRPLTLGGWDVAARRPKPARRAAPSGSVFFVELEDASEASALFDALDGRSLCAGDDAKQGLGLARLGVW